MLGALHREAKELGRAALKGPPAVRIDDPKAWDVILEAVQIYYGRNKHIRKFIEYQKLTSIKNEGDNLDKFIRKFTLRLTEAATFGLEMPQDLQAYMLPASSGLPSEKIQQALISADQHRIQAGAEELRRIDVEMVFKTLQASKAVRPSSGRKPCVRRTSKLGSAPPPLPSPVVRAPRPR